MSFNFQEWLHYGESMPVKRNFTKHPEFGGLPEAVQKAMGEKGHAWLPDSEKKRIMEDFCYPEPDEDY